MIQISSQSDYLVRSFYKGSVANIKKVKRPIYRLPEVVHSSVNLTCFQVERVEIKDVRVPVQLQRAMAAEAEAAREARAKVVAAEGEQKASTHLKEAALVLEESASALQLRYLQTLNAISTEQSSTIVFPFPIDSLSLSMGMGKEKNKSDWKVTAEY